MKARVLFDQNLPHDAVFALCARFHSSRSFAVRPAGGPSWFSAETAADAVSVDSPEAAVDAGAGAGVSPLDLALCARFHSIRSLALRPGGGPSSPPAAGAVGGFSAGSSEVSPAPALETDAGVDADASPLDLALCARFHSIRSLALRPGGGSSSPPAYGFAVVASATVLGVGDDIVAGVSPGPLAF